MKSRSEAVFVFGLTLVLAGCNSKTTMHYSREVFNVIPYVQPGETISWDTPIQWDHDDSPCEPQTPRDSTVTSCTIQKKPKTAELLDEII